MLRRLLRSTARYLNAHPYRVLLLAIAPPLLLGSLVLWTPVDLSFTGVMDRSNPEVARYFEASRKYQLGGTLIALLEGDDEVLDEVVASLQATLEEHPAVRSVQPAVPEEWLVEQAPWLVDDETFAAWVRQVEEPTNLENGRWLERRFAELAAERRRTRPEGLRLLQVRMARDPFDEEMGGDSFFAVERRVEELLAGSGVSASFSGLPAVAAQDQRRTLGTIRRLSPLSLLLVLGIFHFVERRWLGLLAVVLPLLLAMLGTLGAIGLITGRLTVMETFFGVTVFGLGVDFAVHLLARQREERARGLPFDEALEATLAGTGRGVIAGAVTTAGAFLVISLAPDPVAIHLGLSGGIGLLLCLALMLTLLPATWVLLERRRDRRGIPHRAAHSVLPVPLIPNLAHHAVAHPRSYLAGSVLLLVMAALGVPRFSVETRIDKVFNRNVPAVQVVERVAEEFGWNGAPWVVATSTLEEAVQLTARFRASPDFTFATSVADFVPVPGGEIERRLLRLEELRPQMESLIVLGEGLLSGGGGPGLAAEQRQQVAGLIRATEVLQRAAAEGPPSLDSLPPGLRDRFVGPGGELLVLAYSRGSTFDAEKAQRDRLAAQAIAPGATSISATLEAVLLAERPWLWPVSLGILLVVATVLYVDFRHPWLALLALVPVVVGVGVTFGALCWLGIPFNVMTVMVVPLIVGLGVDDGIHVVHRMIEDRSVPIDHAAASVGRAIVMTTATTCSSFAILLLTDHPGLETMGLVMLIGLPVCLLASVTTLPALAALGASLGPRTAPAAERKPKPEPAGRPQKGS